MAVTGAWPGGDVCADVRNILDRGGSGVAPIWVRDMGHVPAD